MEIDIYSDSLASPNTIINVSDKDDVIIHNVRKSLTLTTNNGQKLVVVTTADGFKVQFANPTELIKDDEYFLFNYEGVNKFVKEKV